MRRLLAQCRAQFGARLGPCDFHHPPFSLSSRTARLQPRGAAGGRIRAMWLGVCIRREKPRSKKTGASYIKFNFSGQLCEFHRSVRRPIQRRRLSHSSSLLGRKYCPRFTLARRGFGFVKRVLWTFAEGDQMERRKACVGEMCRTSGAGVPCLPAGLRDCLRCAIIRPRPQFRCDQIISAQRKGSLMKEEWRYTNRS
jgi:hypothetical protein